MALIPLFFLSMYGFRGLLHVANAFNPMLLAFLESFSIVNNSGEAVEVMPLGMLTVTGRYGPLPRYKGFFPPAVPLQSSQPIHLSPAAEAKLTYDYDDINFRHILIHYCPIISQIITIGYEIGSFRFAKDFS